MSRDKSFTVHEKNIQTLAIELFRVVKGLSPEIMREVFPVKKENKLLNIAQNRYLRREIYVLCVTA